MRQFPIMTGQGTKGPCPSLIPWEAIAPYEGQAKTNHDQSLERLAERGGLDPIEAFFVMTGRGWRDFKMSDELEREACAFLDKVVRDREELRAENAKFRADLEHAKVDRDCCCAGTEELRKKLEVVELQVRDHELEVEQFNEGFAAANAGKPVDSQPSYEKDMDSWEVGWAWAHHCANRHAKGTEKQERVVVEMGDDGKPRCARCQKQDYPLMDHQCEVRS